MKHLLVFSLMALFNSNLAIASEKIIELSVTEKGFEPSSLNVAPGIDLTLNITRKTNATCATQVVIPSRKIKKDLPLNELVKIKVGKVSVGEIRFACGMDMITGVINVK